MKDHPKPITIPRWYQDLSIPQMQKVFQLGDIMRADYAERVTGRTMRALGDIGVTSTFVRITSEQIRELRRLTDLDPVKFLYEIYRIVTGRYFTDEEYKKVYDCNERIILSAIAFLTLPEIVIELHSRIPMGETSKFPPKPVPQKIPPRRRSTSPYLEPLFVRPDHRAYKQELSLWRQRCQSIPVPRAILPPWLKQPASVELPTIAESERSGRGDEKRSEYRHEERSDKKKDRTARVTSPEEKTPERIFVEKPRERGRKKNVALTGHEDRSREIAEKEVIDPRLDRPKTHSEKSSTLAEKESRSMVGELHEGKTPSSRHDYSKRSHVGDPSSMGERETHSTILNSRDDYARQQLFDKTPQLSERYGHSTVAAGTENKANDERLDYSKRPHSTKNTWLGEKDTHLIVTGLSENAAYPISYETSGLACVTPDNSDESFFAELNLADSRKTYPRGRENLSRNWQEWLQAVDEEFMKVEKDADKIIDSIKDTLKLIGPEISCDVCCSCRQARKANINYHKTKTPRAVIDSVVIDGTKNKYIVGSLSMNSPAPSASGSDADLPEVIASHDEIVKNKIISGVTNENGETKYYISGVSKETEHVPSKVMSNSNHPKPIKNVPPCGCAIEKMINEGVTTVMSDDDIPWTRNDAPCIGKKYRPKAIGACQEHPSNKLCGRNPFKKKIDEKIKASLRAKNNSDEDDYPEERNMYSLAAFQPCGDEDGMAVCGGPWGAVNVPDAEELARREAEAKLILKSPPCGEKPGRAVCGAPFGTRHPVPKKPKKDDDEDEEEEEEELDEEELKERKKREREERRKKAREQRVERAESVPNRDERCSTVAGKIRGADKSEGPAPARGTGKMEKHRSAKIARSDKRKKSSGEFHSENKSEAESGGKGRYSSSESAKGRKRLRGRSKEERRQIEADEEHFYRRAQTKELKDRWNRMKRLSNKFITSPIVLPDEPPRMCKREDRRDRCGESEENTRLSDEESTREGPFGHRTKSEEALPAEKTLGYLVKPEEPLGTVPLRPGGKPCECRENRNKKKTLLYNVSALVSEGKGKRDGNNSRVIEGLIYVTPTPSVRISEDYIPEYELYDSPYEMCVRERKDDDFRYMERYLGPKSLTMKKPQAVLCNCSSSRQKIIDDPAKQTLKENEKELIIKVPAVSAEAKWNRTFDDQGLVNFYARCRDNVPCWLRCVEFSKDGCCTLPRVLQVKRPVCECRYERKIVRREEEKAKWLRRQEKLKTMRKQPCSQVAGLSRPMRTETNVMISNVTRTHREEEDIDDIEYCVSGITQDRVMGPAECILSGVGMHTPLITPEMSKAEIPIAKPHRHWSPMDTRAATADLPIRTVPHGFSPIIPQARATAHADVENLRPGDENETDWRNKLWEQPNKRVDVLFQSGQGNILNADRSAKKKPDYLVGEDKKSEKDRKRKETKADKLPSIQPAPRQAREFPTPRLINAESGKKPTALLAARQSHRSDTAGSVNAESKKKSSAKEIGRNDEGNVRALKSTGNIPKETKSDLLGRKKETGSKVNLAKLLQMELEKMAEEGFLFAKLPACHQMPQLQYWIMYRKGIAFTSEEKKKLMNQSIKIWTDIEKTKPKKIDAPVIEMSKEALENLTFDRAEEIKRDVASKKATFYSRVRKLRVLQARAMWNLMEFGKFPGVSFKKAYFTYQAGKEADGFVFRPWEMK